MPPDPLPAAALSVSQQGTGLSRADGPDPVDWARQIVLRLLTLAPRSRAQLEGALRRRNCPDHIAAIVLDRMQEVGLVDDAAYAEMLIRSKQASRGLARRALAQELRTKGIDDEVAKQALEAIDPHLEEERARELVARKLPAMAGLDPLVQTRRLAGMLSRKGYSADLCLRIVREAVREAPEHQRD